jgi:hypothetical protein
LDRLIPMSSSLAISDRSNLAARVLVQRNVMQMSQI